MKYVTKVCKLQLNAQQRSWLIQHLRRLDQIDQELSRRLMRKKEMMESTHAWKRMDDRQRSHGARLRRV